MNFSKIMIVAGSIIVGFGILFIAQSQSVVGPESSFMYRNPEWAANGAVIVAAGAVVIAIGIAVMFKRKNA
ncbi:MAG: hypothetical protein ACRD38_02380 [Nitrososphaerales archaeon]